MDFVQVAYDYVDTDHKIVDELDELVAMCFMVMVAFEIDIFNCKELEDDGNFFRRSRRGCQGFVDEYVCSSLFLQN